MSTNFLLALDGWIYVISDPKCVLFVPLLISPKKGQHWMVGLEKL
jgi:hypothetical protein